jgi:hypothetical protein
MLTQVFDVGKRGVDRCGTRRLNLAYCKVVLFVAVCYVVLTKLQSRHWQRVYRGSIRLRNLAGPVPSSTHLCPQLRSAPHNEGKSSTEKLGESTDQFVSRK